MPLAGRGSRGSYPEAIELFSEAIGGRREAVEIVEKARTHLAVAIINLILLLNPEMVVIGGAMCELPYAPRPYP